MRRLAALVENHQGLHGASEFLQSEGVDWTEADQTYVTDLEAWLAAVDSVLDLADRNNEVEMWRRQREKNGPVTLLNVHDHAERMRVVLEGIMARIAGTRITVIADRGISSPRSSTSLVRGHDKNNPWMSGSFYLVCFITLGAFLLITAKSLSWTILPVVIVGCVVALGLIGAFQLRNYERLSEETFIKLMAMTFKRLPLIRRHDNLSRGA